MFYFFAVSLSGTVLVTPLHFLSVEHANLERRFGKKKGIRVGELLGIFSGWGFFISWIGVWLSSQPRFSIPFFQSFKIPLPVIGFPIPILQLIIAIPFFLIGAWFGIKGVKETTLRVAETHRTERITTKGVYSIVRHPQYLGALIAHIGISFLLSALYSLLVTPLMIALIFLMSNKEEKELVKEFGEEYLSYQRKVPMLLPKKILPIKRNF